MYAYVKPTLDAQYGTLYTLRQCRDHAVFVYAVIQRNSHTEKPPKVQIVSKTEDENWSQWLQNGSKLASSTGGVQYNVLWHVQINV